MASPKGPKGGDRKRIDREGEKVMHIEWIIASLARKNCLARHKKRGQSFMPKQRLRGKEVLSEGAWPCVMTRKEVGVELKCIRRVIGQEKNCVHFLLRELGLNSLQIICHFFRVFFSLAILKGKTRKCRWE